MARLVKEKVANGSYATESEVIREGLRALQEREDTVERWLNDDVVPTYDAYKARSDRAQLLHTVRVELDAFMDAAEQD